MFVALCIPRYRPKHLEDFAAFLKRIETGMEGTDCVLSIDAPNIAGQIAASRQILIGDKNYFGKHFEQHRLVLSSS